VVASFDRICHDRLITMYLATFLIVRRGVPSFNHLTDGPSNWPCENVQLLIESVRLGSSSSFSSSLKELSSKY